MPRARKRANRGAAPASSSLKKKKKKKEGVKRETSRMTPREAGNVASHVRMAGACTAVWTPSRWGSPLGLSSEEGGRARRGVARWGSLKGVRARVPPWSLCVSFRQQCATSWVINAPLHRRPGGDGFGEYRLAGGSNKSAQPAGGLGSQAGWAPKEWCIS